MATRKPASTKAKTPSTRSRSSSGAKSSGSAKRPAPSSKRQTAQSTKSRATTGKTTRKNAGSAKKPTATQKKKAADAPASKVYKRSEQRAKKILESTRETNKLAAQAESKLKGLKFAADLADNLSTLIRMLKAYAKGQYRDVPWTTMVAATAAVVYFVSPVDLIPDPIPGAGYLDDATVIAFVIAAIDTDLNAFRGWEDQRG